MTELQMLSLGYAVFVVAIAVEGLASTLRRDGFYRLDQFVVNIGHGMVFQVFDGFTKALVFLPLVLLSAHAPATLPLDAAWAWLLGFLAYDFLSYWRHRHHHEIGFLWAIHGVHHAAEDFNFAAALRQAILQNVVAWVWFLPLVLFVPLPMFLGLVVLDYVYQFFQHTRYVPKLGPLEWVFNTPSHHRVHHGTEPEYLDRNYGGMLIVWDRLFGTFQEEGAEPTYGLTRPMQTLNPLWGNLALWRDLGRAAASEPTWGGKLAMLVAPPARMEARLRELAADGPQAAAEPPTRLGWYVFLSFGGVTALLGALAWVPPEAWLLRGAIGAAVVLGGAASAGLLEGRRWGWLVEGCKLALLAALVVGLALAPGGTLVLLAAGVAMGAAVLGALAMAASARAARGV